MEASLVAVVQHEELQLLLEEALPLRHGTVNDLKAAPSWPPMGSPPSSTVSHEVRKGRLPRGPGENEALKTGQEVTPSEDPQNSGLGGPSSALAEPQCSEVCPDRGLCRIRRRVEAPPEVRKRAAQPEIHSLAEDCRRGGGVCPVVEDEILIGPGHRADSSRTSAAVASTSMTTGWLAARPRTVGTRAA